MIAEIKKGLKLIRYGYALKSNVAVGIVFLVIGIVMLCIGESGIMLGTIYIALTPALILQVTNSLLYSGMVASSRERKMLELYFPDFTTIVMGVLGYIVTVGSAVFWSGKRTEEMDSCIETMLVSSIVLAMLLIYFGAVNKYFILSVLAFAFGIIIGISGGIITWHFAGEFFTMGTAAIVSLVIIAVGIIISGLLRRLFYRKQISPLAGGFSLRKAMQ